jgi:hypothetical protein
MNIFKLLCLTIKQMRLRRKYNIHLNVHYFGKFDFTVKINPDKILNERKIMYDTYEECLEKGVKWCLKYLKNSYEK